MWIHSLDGGSLCSIILETRLFVLHLVAHEETPLCCGQWWVHSSQMKSRHHFFYIFWDKRARTRTHTHTHTEQLKIEWHLSAYISSYRPQHHGIIHNTREHGIWHVHHQGEILWMVWHNSPPLHCSQQFTKNDNSPYRNCWTGHGDPHDRLPCSPHLTPLDFYLCGYKRSWWCLITGMLWITAHHGWCCSQTEQSWNQTENNIHCYKTSSSYAQSHAEQ